MDESANVIEDLPVSPKEIQQIFQRNETEIDIETARKILLFLFDFANIALDQIAKHDS